MLTGIKNFLNKDRKPKGPVAARRMLLHSALVLCLAGFIPRLNLSFFAIILSVIYLIICWRKPLKTDNKALALCACAIGLFLQTLFFTVSTSKIDRSEIYQRSSRDNMYLLTITMSNYAAIMGDKKIPQTSGEVYQSGILDSFYNNNSQNITRIPSKPGYGYRLIPFSANAPQDKLAVIEEPGAWKDTIQISDKSAAIYRIKATQPSVIVRLFDSVISGKISSRSQLTEYINNTTELSLIQ